MKVGYTMVQTAQLVAAIRWATGRLFEITGAWSADVVGVSECGSGECGSSEVGVWLASVSRRFGVYREMMDELQPDSERLAIYRHPDPPDPAVMVALNELAAANLGWMQQFVMVLRVLIPQMSDICNKIERTAAPHCDEALARTVRMLRLDLSLNRYRGERILGKIEFHQQETEQILGEVGFQMQANEIDELTGRAASLIAEEGLIPSVLLRSS